MSEESENSKKLRGHKKWVIISVAVIVVAIAAFFMTGNLRTYNQAMKLEESALYTEAITIYQEIPTYRDSIIRINECKYQIALEMENDGKYAQAQAAFEAIADYSNSATHVSECKYQQALVLEADGDYADAQVAFEAIADHSDSATHASDCKYQQALAMEANGRYADAQVAFEAITDYSDSATHINECIYQQALALEALCKFAEAQAFFESVADYLDSATHINECKYQQAIEIEKNGATTYALTAFQSLGEYKDSADHVIAIQNAIDTYDSERTRIATEEDAFDTVVTVATTMLAEDKPSLDESTKTSLQTALDDAVSVKQAIGERHSVLSRMVDETNVLKKISYTSQTEHISTLTEALANSIKKYSLVDAPEEAFIVDRLSCVGDIAYLAAVTEENDPNNQLGKAGGYTAQIYFSSPLVLSTYANNPGFDVIEAGTDCGGSIEVYRSVEEAERRNEYLAGFDGTVYASGSHTIVGTVIVRTSHQLKASQQRALEAEIIEAFTSLNPGPIIERAPELVPTQTEQSPEADDLIASSNDGNDASASPDTTLPLISVKDVGFSVDNGWLHYAVILHNNSDDTAVYLPQFRVTSRNANGDLLGVETMVLSGIYPNQDIVWASLAGEASEIPDSVDIDIVEPDSYNLMRPGNMEYPDLIPLEVQGATIKKGTFPTLIGEVYNPNKYDISMAAIVVVFRDKDGKLMAGCDGYCDGVKAGTKTPFEINLYSELMGETYEVYAMPW